MYLKKITKSKVQDGDFIIVQAPFPDDKHPFHFQYSGTALVITRGLYLVDAVIDKFNRQGHWVHLPSKDSIVPVLFMTGGSDKDTYFRVELG